MSEASFERIPVDGTLHVVTTVAVRGTVASITVHTEFVSTNGQTLSTPTSVRGRASHSTEPVIAESSLEFLISNTSRLVTGDVRHDVTQMSDMLVQLKCDSRGSATERAVDRVRRQLAEIELDIKRIMSEIEAKRAEETATREALEEARDSAGAILENVQRAAESYKQMLDAADFLFH